MKKGNSDVILIRVIHILRTSCSTGHLWKDWRRRNKDWKKVTELDLSTYKRGVLAWWLFRWQNARSLSMTGNVQRDKKKSGLK